MPVVLSILELQDFFLKWQQRVSGDLSFLEAGPAG
jgi:hypothetical protein